MRKIDPYLLHAFETIEKGAEQEFGDLDRRRYQQAIRLPMLIRVTDDFFSKETVLDLEITSRMGDVVACRGSQQTLRLLEQDQTVIAIEGSRRALPLDTARTLGFVNAVNAQSSYSEDGSNCIIAVIDDGIDVLHEAFLDHYGNSRIIGIWDQTDPSGSHPAFTYARGLQKQVVNYGTLHSASDIKTYIRAGHVPPGLQRHVAEHGTHVASIAAGRPTRHFSGGVAPNARLLVVIPDLQTSNNTLSIGYSTSHMDAVAYILHFARGYIDPVSHGPLPLIINVSQGMNAGAHDGTTLLETVFDEATGSGRNPGVVIVKSAGNTRDKKIHATLSMSPSDRDELIWYCPDDHDGPDVIELWYNASDDFDFLLEDPSTETASAVVSKTHPHHKNTFSSGNITEIALTNRHQDNGDNCLQVFINRGLSPSIRMGSWKLQISSGIVRSEGRIQSWLERNDNSFVEFTNHISEGMTISIPGTARSIICVSALDCLAAPARMPTPIYSAYGPTRDGRNKPDLAAPGHEISAAKAGSFDHVTTMSGTSMAAPHVTGAVALLSSLWAKKNGPGNFLTANQIRAALIQAVQYSTGKWDEKRGYGILDVDSLIRAFF